MEIRRRGWVGCLLLLVFFGITAVLLFKGFTRVEPTSFEATLRGVRDVYDGDTFTVQVDIGDTDLPQGTAREGWPGIWFIDDQIYARTKVRLNGVDTPEKRPRKAGRSAKSLANEKKAAKAARDAVIKLFKANGWKITIKSVKNGKYAGRVVADVFVGNLNLASYLIKNGHALPYSGGTKKVLDWERLDKGLMRE